MNKSLQLISDDELENEGIRLKSPNRKSKEKSQKKSMKSERMIYRENLKNTRNNQQKLAERKAPILSRHT